jgi:hypothetical protein
LWRIAFKLTKYLALKHPSWRRLNPQVPNHLTFNTYHETLQPSDQHQSLFGLTDEHATDGQFNIDHGGILHMPDDSLVNNNDVGWLLRF